MENMNSNDTAKAAEFSDSICTCTSCDHKIALERMKAKSHSIQ